MFQSTARTDTQTNRDARHELPQGLTSFGGPCGVDARRVVLPLGVSCRVGLQHVIYILGPNHIVSIT